MKADDARLREAELYRALQAWDVPGAVVIGGYAASARSVPRYSHDLDFLLPATSLPEARKVLGGAGLALSKEDPKVEQNYGGSFEQWSGGVTKVTVELLAESVQDRDFRVPLPYVVLAERAETLQIRGVAESPLRLPVACPEALIAMKLQPMRTKDRADICCLANGPIDERHLERLMRPLVAARPGLLKERLERLRSDLASDAEAHCLLGPRIAGPPGRREPVIRSARRLLRLMDSWLP